MSLAYADNGNFTAATKALQPLVDAANSTRRTTTFFLKLQRKCIAKGGTALTAHIPAQLPHKSPA